MITATYTRLEKSQSLPPRAEIARLGIQDNQNGIPTHTSVTESCAHEYSILLGRGVLPFHSHSFQASSVGKRKITLYARARSIPASLGAKRACVPPLFRPETGRLARSGREKSVREEAAFVRPIP